jgi:hypothetical protein
VKWALHRREWFAEGGLVFDVSLIKRYLATNPVPIGTVLLKDLAHWRQNDSASGRPGKRAAQIRSDRLNRADPAVPIILAEIDGRRFLLDGHHRLERAAHQDRSRIAAVVVRDRELLMRSLRARSALSSLWWQEHVAPRLTGLVRARGRAPRAGR